MNDLLRVAALSPPVHVGNPPANVDETLAIVGRFPADLYVLPELGLSGYTCGDLFTLDAVLEASQSALLDFAKRLDHGVAVVGLPYRLPTCLMNVAAVVTPGRVAGLVPKTYLPNYREFYEARHFQAARDNDPPTVELGGEDVPFGTDLLFRLGRALVGVEICEDFWTPIPPSSHAALAGANVLVNLSASNEVIGKPEWRRDLVRSQSGRCIAAYAYASAGPGESTSDLVFGGHCLIAENGSVLAETRAIGGGEIETDGVAAVADIDLGRLDHDRRVTGSFDDARGGRHGGYRVIELGVAPQRRSDLRRRVDATPFVPENESELTRRCAEILDLQTAGFIKRLGVLPEGLRLSIGVSGGLDSTLALLVAVRACDAVGKSRSDILGITMPGFGTTPHTRTSADRLIEQTGVTGAVRDIRQLALDTFRSMNHSPLGIAIDDDTTVEGLQSALYTLPDDAADLVFENVQARLRTMLLMSEGFVIGTGDMSEQALGWCTYNADHMSMYNVNTSVPKTLVQFLVRHAADHLYDGELREVLHRVADTPISPELLPATESGEIRQSTEAVVGPYELHDFFLYHTVRNGFDREKILFLAERAEFQNTDDPAVIAETYDTFLRRFYANQFKRNCVPDGPKVGSVSLSPRGDWRMPSDAEPVGG